MMRRQRQMKRSDVETAARYQLSFGTFMLIWNAEMWNLIVRLAIKKNELASGLPDFSWYMIPKTEKCNK
jgi:hypothetical protein